MANNFYRITNSLQTGYALETTSTSATLSASAWISDVKTDNIQLNLTMLDLDVGGDFGTTKKVPGKSFGELKSIKWPMTGGQGLEVLKCLGNVSGNNIQLGGVMSLLASPNKGRASSAAISVQQYDSGSIYTLYNAKPSMAKVGGKAGELIMLEASLQGNYAKGTSTLTQTQQATSGFAYNVLEGSTITLSGQSYDFSDVEIDFGPVIKAIESGAASTGVTQFEIVDIKPKITLTVYPLSDTIADLVTQFQAGSVLPFVWTFGAGTGNTYTITANTQLATLDIPNAANDVQSRKITLEPVFNASNVWKLNINVS